MSNDKKPQEVMHDFFKHSLAAHRVAEINTRTDAELAQSAGAGAGDVMAFEVITLRYSRLLFRAARGVVADPSSKPDFCVHAACCATRWAAASKLARPTPSILVTRAATTWSPT